MATFRCKPFAGGHVSPPSSGSAIGGPRDWSLADDGSLAGNVLRLDVAAPPPPIPGYKLTYYELALSERNGATTIRRVLGGPALNYTRRFRTDSSETPQRGQLRSVWQRLNQMSWSSQADPAYQPIVGDTVVQASTGASATVSAVVSAPSGGVFFIALANISGTFEDEAETIVGGNVGNQGSVLHCTHLEAMRETITSEWSLPHDILPGAGAPQVAIVASKTTCLQGEALLFEAQPTGFDAERPIHDLHFRFYVDKPGEQGAYASLPDFFENSFGAGSDNRAEGYTQVWGFVPRTTGVTTVYCEVRDSAGNTATGSISITAVSPASAFAQGDIYAASAALTPVPGAAGANLYATLAELEAALPLGGEGLILLDTADLHSPGDFSDLFLQDLLTERCVIMPYSANGIGADAGARAVMNRALTSRAAEVCIFGIDLIGPYDPTNPFSITEYPKSGLDTDLAGYMAAAECKLTGWRITVKLPFSGSTAAFVDLCMTDYQDFGFFGGDVGAHAISGCYTFTNPQSWRETGKSSASDNATVGFFVDHGPYRASRPDGVRGFSKSVFFSCCSWGGTGYSQPPLRLFGNGATERPRITHGTEILTEGLSLGFGSTTRGGGNTTCTPQDIVWDKFFHITSMQPLNAVSFGMGGVTLRNGVIATSSNPAEVTGSGVRQHLSFSNENPVPGQNDNENNPINISFLSVIDLRNDAGQSTDALLLSAVNAEFPMNDISIENILTYAPNFTLSNIGAEPLDTAPRWTPLYAGQYFWNETTPTVAAQTPDTSFATPDTVTASFEPASGSDAYQTATGNAPYDDIRSRVRPVGAASRGAYDPGAV